MTRYPAPEDDRERNSLLCVLPGDRGRHSGSSWRRPGQTDTRARGTSVQRPQPGAGSNSSYLFPTPFSSSWMPRRGIETTLKIMGIRAQTPPCPPRRELSLRVDLRDCLGFRWSDPPPPRTGEKMNSLPCVLPLARGDNLGCANCPGQADTRARSISVTSGLDRRRGTSSR